MRLPAAVGVMTLVCRMAAVALVVVIIAGTPEPLVGGDGTQENAAGLEQ